MWRNNTFDVRCFIEDIYVVLWSRDIYWKTEAIAVMSITWWAQIQHQALNIKLYTIFSLWWYAAPYYVEILHIAPLNAERSVANNGHECTPIYFWLNCIHLPSCTHCVKMERYGAHCPPHHPSSLPTPSLSCPGRARKVWWEGTAWSPRPESKSPPPPLPLPPLHQNITHRQTTRTF